MPSPEPFLIFTRKLRDLRLRYMIGGSVAAIFYGEPRLTYDVESSSSLGPTHLARWQPPFRRMSSIVPQRR
jgi:hypothetical protein